MIKNATDGPPAAAVPAHPEAADYQLGPAVTLVFTDAGEDDLGWWDPDGQRIVVDRELRGRELVETVLHEIGHMLCGDHADNTHEGGDGHRRLDEWATQAAALLEVLRPGRWAAPA